MITLLHLLSYVGSLAAFLFVTLSLASGLLWLAELIEEHSKHAKVIGMRAIYVVITLHILLLFTDSLPLIPTLFSILCHLVYLQNFSSSWPYISLTSPRFILSCLLVVADHFTWFFHFAEKAQESKRRVPKYRYGTATKTDGPGFMDVAAFFGICVWFVPLFLFLSLSANDNALPSTPGIDLSSPALNAFQAHRQLPSTSLMKSLLTPLLSLLPRLRRRTNKRDDSGLLAPRTPIRGSPLHSPVQMNMQSSYFPWGEDGTRSGSASPSIGAANHGSVGASSYSGSTLTPESARGTMRKNLGVGESAPPPRRVQSDAMVAKAPNPRGLAIRDGRPVIPDALLVGEPESVGGDSGMRNGIGGVGLARKKSSNEIGGRGGPAMSLGPEGSDPVGGAELVDSGAGGGKRKAD